MGFADLEQRTNAAVMRRLSNARGQQVGGASDFPVIFDRAHVETAAGVSATAPIATVLDADIVGFVAHTTQMTIGDGTYTVLDIQPDGTGMSQLVLEAA
jgi:hypothetical protein